MKTQKQLPKLSYIQENEKTNEYCERLGISRDDSTTEEDYGDYLVFKDGEFIDSYYGDDFNRLKNNYPNAVFVELSDYLPSNKKQLPNEFTFICDEHSREQLEKLGVYNDCYSIASYKVKYAVKDNVVVWSGENLVYNYPLINLFDYIEQEQPEPKWQPLFNYMSKNHGLNLLETDMQEIERIVLKQIKIEELAMLNQELEEVRLKEKQILEKIEGLKK